MPLDLAQPSMTTMTDQDSTEIIQSVIHGVSEHIVSFKGQSQYGVDGIGASACGLAALNCARVILQKDKDGLQGKKLLLELTKQETFEVRAMRSI